MSAYNLAKRELASWVCQTCDGDGVLPTVGPDGLLIQCPTCSGSGFHAHAPELLRLKPGGKVMTGCAVPMTEEPNSLNRVPRMDTMVCLRQGTERPYDYTRRGASVDWAHTAARGVVANLLDRRGIKTMLELTDARVRVEIIDDLADVIREAAKALDRDARNRAEMRGKT